MDYLEFGVEITPIPALYEQITGRVPVEHVDITATWGHADQTPGNECPAVAGQASHGRRPNHEFLHLVAGIRQ